MTWFVLLIQDGNAIVTQCPGTECFATEDDAIAFAVDCARNDTDGVDGAVYHVMATTRTVTMKRRISIKIEKPKTTQGTRK